MRQSPHILIAIRLPLPTTLLFAATSRSLLSFKRKLHYSFKW